MKLLSSLLHEKLAHGQHHRHVADGVRVAAVDVDVQVALADELAVVTIGRAGSIRAEPLGHVQLLPLQGLDGVEQVGIIVQRVVLLLVGLKAGDIGVGRIALSSCL